MIAVGTDAIAVIAATLAAACATTHEPRYERLPTSAEVEAYVTAHWADFALVAGRIASRGGERRGFKASIAGMHTAFRIVGSR